MENIIKYLENPLVLIIISFVLGNCLRKLPPIWKIIVYLVVEAIEHLIYPLALRKMIKRLVNGILTERQRELLDQLLLKKGYLHSEEKKEEFYKKFPGLKPPSN